MRTLANLITSVVLAVWVVAIAILSVQNATLVSLRFLFFESIKLPVGLVLAFFVGVGIIGMAIIQSLWRLLAGSRQRQQADDDFSDFEEV